ncbi:MAG: phosphoribosylformylglycinamidine cyclo-ligase [Nitrospirota bacterium]|nr:phosphoribosylformylglycinamidine cyclo-ligase [Nitrospirota bacterium]
MSELSYRDAGVDIDAGNRLVERIKPMARSTAIPGVLGGLGGFGGLFAPDLGGMTEPVLVSGTDGVGTKLKIAFGLNRHDTVGIDLVAMSVNDIVVTGARPLFFLDYFATGRLSVDDAAQVVSGIAEGCRQAGCALLGGETAEMPGFYADGEYDLAGFAVGIVDRPRIIDGSRVAAGDAVIGMASSGLHSNGFSLARKVFFERGGLTLADPLKECGKSVGEALLTPTRIYVRQVLDLIARFDVRALAHITGGGLTENLPRVFPKGCGARLNAASWEIPPVFTALERLGNVARPEMLRTFNMGIGMCVVVPAGQAADVVTALGAAGERAWVIGEIVAGDGVVTYA